MPILMMAEHVISTTSTIFSNDAIVSIEPHQDARSMNFRPRSMQMYDDMIRVALAYGELFSYIDIISNIFGQIRCISLLKGNVRLNLLI